MTATVTVRLIELEPSNPASYDGTRIELSGGGGYVEVNQTYSEVTISETIDLSNTDPISNFVKRMLFYVFGDPSPATNILGKDRR